MIVLPDLTLERLLDHVAQLASRRAVGHRSLEPRAYAADAEGRVVTFAFPMPSDDEGRQALAALLQSEMRKRDAVMSVLAIEATAAIVDQTVECLVLEGQQLRPDRRTEVRLLAIQRVEGREISGLRPLTTTGAAQNRRADARQARRA